ncbi:hypothetical protein D3D01_16520 [Haloarcula sp. Atlit-7R]|nr:hypothetical protein D3D01_16520 [Haloarcula sp. Atlit-7R]
MNRTKSWSLSKKCRSNDHDSTNLQPLVEQQSLVPLQRKNHSGLIMRLTKYGKYWRTRNSSVLKTITRIICYTGQFYKI